jgi:hypothetical protein
MQKHLRVTLATSVAAALTTGFLATSSAAATAAPAPTAAPADHLQGDFNGDGFGDLAVSAAGAAVSGRTGAGSVTVLYGSSSGAGTSKIQTITQDSPGVPGAAEKDDRFGNHTAAGDFNGDGHTDLAVGAPGEDAGSDVNGGTVVILWGATGGLTGGTTVSDPTRSIHDWFGRVLAAGDYDGDGRADLAIASDIEKVDVYRGGFTKTGGTGGRYTVTTPVMPVKGPDIFNLTPGDVNADGRTDLLVDGYEGDSTGEWAYNANYYLPGSGSGITTTGRVKLPAGIISDIGDANGDGYGDIVIGNSWEAGDGVGVAKGGAVDIVYGTLNGPADRITLHQDSPGVPGGGETGDSFGFEVSFGDVNGDGLADLAIGSPNEDVDGVADAGMVTVLYSRGSDFSGPGNQNFHQNVPGVPGAGEAGDGFGGEVFLSDTDGDGRADLAVGSPGENNSDGQATTFRATGTGTGIDVAGRGFGLTAAGLSATGTPLFGHNITG